MFDNIAAREIEDLREELQKLVVELNGDLQHPRVMELSTRLDQLIVAWQKSALSDIPAGRKRRRRKKTS